MHEALMRDAIMALQMRKVAANIEKIEFIDNESCIFAVFPIAKNGEEWYHLHINSPAHGPGEEEMAFHIAQRVKTMAPSMTLAIDAKAKEMRARGMDVVGFGAGEPDFPTPEHICQACKEALDQGMTRYTPVSGTLTLRQAVCQKLHRDNGLTYDPAEVMVSCGAKHTLYNIFQTILDPGDEVLIPTPCWVSYPEMVRVAGGVPVFVPASEEEGFIPRAEDIRRRITPRTRAIIINSPSNPNGCIWGEDILRAVGETAVAHDLYLVSDEIYEMLVYGGAKHVSIASLGEEIKQRTLLVNGVSKTYAMTGWRIGYCGGPAPVIAAMTALQSQSTSNPTAMAQYAATAALTGDQTCVEDMRRAFETRRDVLVAGINGIHPLSCRMPDGAFYVMVNIKPLLGKAYRGKVLNSALDFAAVLLEEKQVAAVPGTPFEAEGYCRLSYAVSMETIQKGLDRIAEFVAECR